MREAKATPPASPDAQARANPPAVPSTGVASLLRGNQDKTGTTGDANGNGHGNGPAQGTVEAPETRSPGTFPFRGWLRVSLWLADGLLLGLVALLVSQGRAPLSLLEILAGAAAILLGAWLACLALLLE